MFHNKKDSQRGFTIIEVLIVLAIAGIIMLIVFLAVPALQRNSRNTARNSDSAAAAGILQEAITNNNGKAPAGASTGAISTSSTLAVIPTVLQNQAYSVMDTMDYTVITAGAAALPPSVDAKTLVVRNGLKCNNSGATAYIATSGASPRAVTAANPPTATNIATQLGAGFRNYVIIYAVESTGANITPRCLEV